MTFTETYADVAGYRQDRQDPKTEGCQEEERVTLLTPDRYPQLDCLCQGSEKQNGCRCFQGRSWGEVQDGNL